MLHKNKKIKLLSKKGFVVGFFVMLLALVSISITRIGGVQQAKTSKDSEVINSTPPTEEEKKSGDEAKTKIIENQPKTQTATNGQKSITPTITYAGQYGDQIEVGAYVNTIFEDGGICTLALSNGSASQIVSVDAVKNTSAVDCPVMIIKRSLLSPGKWEATVTYKSNSASGISEKKAFEIR